MNIQYHIDIEETRERLRAWGKWCNTILSMGLKFTGRSLIDNLVNFKGVIINSTVDTIVPENKKAEEIDELINQFGEDHPIKARVLYVHYAMPSKTNDKIQKIGIKKTAYYKYLSEAEAWIDQHL